MEKKEIKLSINDLKKICAGSHDNYYQKQIRKISVYFTWLLYHTKIKPNQITIIWLLLGFIGAVLISLGNYKLSIIGLVIYLIGRILDRCDGEIARAKKIFSTKGYFLDIAASYAINLFLILAIILNVLRTNLGIFNSELQVIFVGSLVLIGYSLKELVPYAYREVYLGKVKEEEKKETKGYFFKFYAIFRHVSLVDYFSPFLILLLLINQLYILLIWYAVMFNILWLGKISYDFIKKE